MNISINIVIDESMGQFEVQEAIKNAAESAVEHIKEKGIPLVDEEFDLKTQYYAMASIFRTE